MNFELKRNHIYKKLNQSDVVQRVLRKNESFLFIWSPDNELEQTDIIVNISQTLQHILSHLTAVNESHSKQYCTLHIKRRRFFY